MLDSLYRNIGGKIKSWAKWIFVVESICAIITGLILLMDWGLDDAWWSLLIIFLGPVIAWVSSWILYAFGELVEDTHAMRNRISPVTEQDAVNEAKRKEKEQAAIEKSEREAKEQAKRVAKHALESQIKRDIAGHAARETLRNDFKKLPPMEKPANFKPSSDWNVKELSTEQIFEIYLAEDEWTESYRYLCYLELKNRLQ